MTKIVSIFALFLFLVGCNTNSLEKEYAIVREIQKEGGAKDMIDVKKIAMSGFGDKKEHIVSLRLSNQGMSQISEKIGELVYLEELFLEGNKLTVLPVQICSLVNLKKLRLSHNKINDLPDCLSRLISISELYLGDNLLTEIPSEALSLGELKVLDLTNNDIKFFNPELKNLEKITSIGLHGNRLCEMDETSKQWIEKRTNTSWLESQRCDE